MAGSDVFDNPNETETSALWYSFTETSDQNFGCFVAVAYGGVLKRRVMFPLSDNDITTRNNNDCYTLNRHMLLANTELYKPPNPNHLYCCSVSSI